MSSLHLLLLTVSAVAPPLNVMAPLSPFPASVFVSPSGFLLLAFFLKTGTDVATCRITKCYFTSDPACMHISMRLVQAIPHFHYRTVAVKSFAGCNRLHVHNVDCAKTINLQSSNMTL